MGECRGRQRRRQKPPGDGESRVVQVACRFQERAEEKPRKKQNDLECGAGACWVEGGLSVKLSQQEGLILENKNVDDWVCSVDMKNDFNAGNFYSFLMHFSYFIALHCKIIAALKHRSLLNDMTFAPQNPPLFLAVPISDNSCREDLSPLLSCNEASPAQTHPCSQQGESFALCRGETAHRYSVTAPKQT